MNAPYLTSGSRAEPPPVAQSTWMPVLALGAMWVDPADHEVALFDAVEEANKSAEVNEEDARKAGFAEGKEAGKTEGYYEGLLIGADQERAKLADAGSKFTPTEKKQ